MQQQYYPSIVLGIAKLFPLHNFMDRRFVPTIELGNSIVFLYQVKNLQLLFGISALPASLFLHFGAIMKYGLFEHKHCDTATADLITEMATKLLTGK